MISASHVCLAWSLWLGCAPPGSALEWAPRRNESTWATASLTVIDTSTLEEQHTLVTRPVGDEVEVWTTRSQVVVDGPGGHQQYDSDAPGPSDPWPFVLQHAVAKAHARIRPTALGPELTDPDAWTEAAKDELFRTSLPPAVTKEGMLLADPVDFAAALRRVFPEAPVHGVLEHSDRIGNVEGVRSETCVTTRSEGLRRWRCEGHIQDADGRLREVESYTEFVVDRDGLLSVEAGYEGLLATPPSSLVPVGGRRLSQREER